MRQGAAQRESYFACILDADRNQSIRNLNSSALCFPALFALPMEDVAAGRL